MSKTALSALPHDHDIDLSPYALEADLPDLSMYATKADVAAMIATAIAGVPPVVVPPVVVPPVVVPPTNGVPLPPSVLAFRGAGSDAAAALMGFLNGVPANTTVLIPDAYRVDSAVKLVARKGLILDLAGTGSIKSGAPIGGYNENYSVLYFQSFSGGNVGCKVRNGTLIGSCPTPGTFTSGKEGQHGILCDGGSDYELSGLTISAMWGDAIEVNSAADKVSAHDIIVPTTGRNGLSVIWGSHVDLARFTFGAMGYMPFDIEPNVTGQPSSFVSIHDGTVDTFTNAFFAADGGGTSDIHDVTLDTITVTGKGMAAGRKASLLSIVDLAGLPIRRKNFRFTNLTSKVSAPGTIFRMSHVDGLVITGIIQPLSSGVRDAILDCPGAITS